MFCIHHMVFSRLAPRTGVLLWIGCTKGERTLLDSDISRIDEELDTFLLLADGFTHLPNYGPQPTVNAYIAALKRYCQDHEKYLRYNLKGYVGEVYVVCERVRLGSEGAEVALTRPTRVPYTPTEFDQRWYGFFRSDPLPEFEIRPEHRLYDLPYPPGYGDMLLKAV